MLGVVCLRTPRPRMSWQTMQTDRQIVAIPQTDRQSGGAYVTRPDILQNPVCLMNTLSMDPHFSAPRFSVHLSTRKYR